MTNCVISNWPKNHDGYASTTRGGITVFHHREVWEGIHGPIPAGMCICHSCDTPDCINPEHLWMGTHADNMADKKRKGRVSIAAAIEAARSPESRAKAVASVKANPEGYARMVNAPRQALQAYYNRGRK